MFNIVKKSVPAIFTTSLLLFCACEPEEKEPLPISGSVEVSTKDVAVTGLRSVRSGGSITADEGQEILQRGVCWNTETAPTIGQKKTMDGTGAGIFTSAISGLSLNTSYFARAYAISASDTTYGNEIAFSTTITSEIRLDSTLEEKAFIGGIISEELSDIIRFSGICWDTSPQPVIAANKNKPLESGSFSIEIANLIPNTRYYFRTFMILPEDTLYSQVVTGITLPKIETSEIYAAAASYALTGGNFSAAENGPEPIFSKGICFSTSPNPDTTSHVLTTVKQGAGVYYHKMTSLNPATTYFIRAYASNEGGISYGEEYSFTTPEAKKITFHLNMADNPTEDQMDAYIHITRSMNEAVNYYDEYTGWRKHVTANYSPGVPTADANYEGWMRFGSNRSYMNVRTTLHEISHTVGIGTSSSFYSLMEDNEWTGSEGTKTVRELTGDQNAIIKQYGVHIGPFGLNYDSEGTAHQDFINHCLILEAMRKDGL